MRGNAGSFILSTITFETLPTMPRAFFFRTTASFENYMAKRQKLELELDEFSESSQLSGPSPKATVHCVVYLYLVNDSKVHGYFQLPDRW